MAASSMNNNNWLGFSLSPQEGIPSMSHTDAPDQEVIIDHDSQNSALVAVSRLGFNSGDKISGNAAEVSGECFDLTTSHDSTDHLPSLNQLPPPFGIFEAFNRTNNNSNHSQQDWNVKEMSMDSDNNNNYKTTSEYSMLMGTSCNSNQHQGGPKLENFLGGHSFSNHGDNHHHHYNMYTNSSLQLPPESSTADRITSTTTDGGATTIGLSMIKNWLRNQPTPPPPQPNPNKSQGTGVQTLSLSMSTDQSQTGSPLPLLPARGGGGDQSSNSVDNKQKGTSTLDSQTGAIEAVPRKSSDTFGQRTSIYRGVTRHRWTGRYEAHLWDNSCRREGQTRKGRQVYLGGYDKEDKAARAYDLAALKYWGTTTTTNFPISNYEKEIEEMKHMTRQEYVASLRRKSSGFSRGASIYRGVTRHHQHGRWQARIGRVAGNKDLYLGTFSTQEEAAEAYDIAAIKFRGLNAVTNFDMSRYDVKSILESSTLPIGGAAKRLKDAEQAEMTIDAQSTTTENTSHLTNGIPNYGTDHHHGWPTIAFPQLQSYSMHHPYVQQRVWCKQEQDDNCNYTFQDVNQIQLGNTHNFFHQPSSVLHNLMSLESSTLDHSSGSNSAVYSNVGGGDGIGYGGFGIPMATVIPQEGNNGQGNGYGDNDIKMLGYDTVFGSSDPNYQARNLYYLQQQSSAGGAVKASGVYDQGSACNNWVPTAVPTLAPRTNNMALCHGAQNFTVWNDT